MRHIDRSEDTQRQIVIARGSPKLGEYHAHPTMAMLVDNMTMFSVWNLGNGGHAGPMPRSDDADPTWTRIEAAPLPMAVAHAAGDSMVDVHRMNKFPRFSRCFRQPVNT